MSGVIQALKQVQQAMKQIWQAVKRVWRAGFNRQPELKVAFKLDGETAQIFLQNILISSFNHADVLSVDIVTTDQGPWEDDVWWQFTLKNEQQPIRIASSADGAELIFTWLETHFTGVDDMQLMAAMLSVENATFAIWSHADSNS